MLKQRDQRLWQPIVTWPAPRKSISCNRKGWGGHHSTTHRQSQHRSCILKAIDVISMTIIIQIVKLIWIANWERTNFAEIKEDDFRLLLCYLKKETQQNMCYLDTGYNNCMCRGKRAFSNLEEPFHNSLKFTGFSTFSMMGKKAMTIQIKGNTIHTISSVFYLPNFGVGQS